MVSPDDIQAADKRISVAERRRREEQQDTTGRLEMHLQESDCRKCGVENDRPSEYCEECE